MTATQPTSHLIEVGDIVGTHGLRGDAKVRLRSGDPTVLAQIEGIMLRRADGNIVSMTIVHRALHKQQMLLRFRDHEDITLVQPLVGATLLVHKNQLPELEADEYYWGDLKGAEVIDRQRGSLGHLTDMMSTAAHDTYVVKGPFGEILIPVVRQFVGNIDLDRHLIEVDLPAGLFPEKE